MICSFCNKTHNTIDCDVESKARPLLKRRAGRDIELFIPQNMCCPFCKEKTLESLDDNTPSLDIICSNCKHIFEVKSKCLSVKDVPYNIKLYSGHYKSLLGRIDQGLNLIVVIYKADRKTKDITIREILFVKNKKLKNTNIINIRTRDESPLEKNLSVIYIKNKYDVDTLNLSAVLNFNDTVELLG